MIDITDDIKLTTFDRENKEHALILNEFENGYSKSNMIGKIGDRLLTGRQTSMLEFSNSYLIYKDNIIVGYLYLTAKQKVGDYIYLEMSILKDYRAKHLGRVLVEAITDYIFENNDSLKEIRFSIDRSNLPSMKVAETCGFYGDIDDINAEKIDFIKENPYYIKRSK